MKRYIRLGIITIGALFLSSKIAITNSSPPSDSLNIESEMNRTENWRVLDPENTLYIDTKKGRIIVELLPEFAPKHVEQIKRLTRSGFYDYLTFHRVIDDFMAQGGDPTGKGNGGSKEDNISGEFFIKRSPSEMKFDLFYQQELNPRNPDQKKVQTGFYKGVIVGTQPETQASVSKDHKVKSWVMHCKGVASMARTADPNSANSQFFLMRGHAPWLDTQYSAWGRVVLGQEYVDAIKTGSVGQTEGFKPDYIKAFHIVSDLPEKEQDTITVLRTDTPVFKKKVELIKEEKKDQFNICDISVLAKIIKHK